MYHCFIIPLVYLAFLASFIHRGSTKEQESQQEMDSDYEIFYEDNPDTETEQTPFVVSQYASSSSERDFTEYQGQSRIASWPKEHYVN